MRRRSGFTLIEMMIVLAIIAALAATLVPIAMNALNQARITGNLTDVESIRLASMQYYYKNNGFKNNFATSDLQYYLEWSNLQGENLSGDYTFLSNDTNTLVLNVPFRSEELANAFYVQWTPVTGQQIATTPDSNHVIKITYDFK